MLMLRSPHEAYRKVDFDARVAGATPQQLVALCYEQLIAALGTAQEQTGRFQHTPNSSARSMPGRPCQ